jgi:hypothetical protein
MIAQQLAKFSVVNEILCFLEIIEYPHILLIATVTKIDVTTEKYSSDVVLHPRPSSSLGL